MIRADQQYKGFASEAFSGLAEHIRQQGASVIRAGVIEASEAGGGLTRHPGFTAIGSRTMRFGSGEQTVFVLERTID